MFEKIKAYLPQLLGKVKQSLANVPKPVKWIALLYGGFVAVIMLAYTLLYAYEYSQGAVQSKDLLPFINLLIGGAMIGFVSFVAGLCIDSNGNGVPDMLEKGGK